MVSGNHGIKTESCKKWEHIKMVTKMAYGKLGVKMENWNRLGNMMQKWKKDQRNIWGGFLGPIR